MKYHHVADFKDAVRKGGPAVAITKVYTDVNEPLDARQIKFTLSTPTIDRDHDKIMQNGWDLINYQRNPVVLLNHKTDQLPIGKCVGMAVEGGVLKGIVDFVPASFPVIGDLAEAVFQLCKSGFMSATSVGFRPLKWDWAEDDTDGIVFSKQELLEFSIVSVPSNPEALIQPPAWFADNAPKHVDLLNRNTDIHKLRLRLLQLASI